MNPNSLITKILDPRLALAGAMLVLAAVPAAARQAPAAAAKAAKNPLVEVDPINVDGTVNV